MSFALFYDFEITILTPILCTYEVRGNYSSNCSLETPTTCKTSASQTPDTLECPRRYCSAAILAAQCRLEAGATAEGHEPANSDHQGAIFCKIRVGLT
jgi:hypothetical protein